MNNATITPDAAKASRVPTGVTSVYLRNGADWDEQRLDYGESITIKLPDGSIVAQVSVDTRQSMVD